MKFTLFAIAALLVPASEAIRINKKDDNGKGLSYDLDVPTLNKSEANLDAKTAVYEAAKAT